MRFCKMLDILQNVESARQLMRNIELASQSPHNIELPLQSLEYIESHAGVNTWYNTLIMQFVAGPRILVRGLHDLFNIDICQRMNERLT